MVREERTGEGGGGGGGGGGRGEGGGGEGGGGGGGGGGGARGAERERVHSEGGRQTLHFSFQFCHQFHQPFFPIVYID